MITTKHKHFKQNPVERAIKAFADGSAHEATHQFDAFADFLKSKYGIDGLRLVVPAICNAFLIGHDGRRRLFIKAGRHSGIYENEYKMQMALYKINPAHFLEPLYYNDYDKFNFFATEFVGGETLNTFLARNPDTELRKTFVADLYAIFCALAASDVVHRDIRPDNFMVIDGHLVLIDFQLAVSKSNYQELEYMRRHPQRLRKLGDPKFQYRPFVWDDNHSLLKVLKFIGRRDEYGALYDKTYHEIQSAIGTARIKSAVREGAIHRLLRHLLPKRTTNAKSGAHRT